MVGDSGNEQSSIRTVPRFGYQWVAPTQLLETVATPGAANPLTTGETVAAPVLAMAGGAGVCRSAGNGPGHPGWVGAQASPKCHRYSRTCWWYRRLP